MSEPVQCLQIAACGATWTVCGELDAHSSPILADALGAGPGTDGVKLDLSGVTFVDSSGLSVLIDAHQRFESEGHRLVLVDLSHTMSRLVELTGLSSYLHVERRD